MKELRFYAAESLAHNEIEKEERDSLTIQEVMNICKMHRAGLVTDDYRIFVSFFNVDALTLLMNEMQADGTLGLMHHEMGTTRVLMIELVHANWGLFGGSM